MVGSTGIDRYPTGRRDERVTYILRAPEKRHRFGISALALGKNHLFTASRDGTIRAWNLPDKLLPNYAHISDVPLAKSTSTFDEHVDWVNDVALVHGYERLVSCSSDTTVKVWNASDPTKSLRTLSEHTDYVKALAHVPNGIASGSLDGRVLVWDLVTGRVRLECGADSDEAQTRNGSVYCMSGSNDGNILISGSTDKTISVWDVRTGDRAVQLRGHSDSVRCLTMKHDARLMLSGGSDSTVKLWDLRQERCIRSFDSYADGSVWALAATPQFDSFVSGGRDGTVWHTDIAENVASLVVAVADTDVRSNMVLDVALAPCNSAVWVSTTGSTVRLWPLSSDPPARESEIPMSSGSDPEPPLRVATPDPSLLQQQNCQRLPCYIIPGLPGIIAHKIMNDRRHVMTCNTQGEYSIWDITKGVQTDELGVVDNPDIDEVAKSHDHEVSVPSWFQVDIRLGSLSVRLDKNSVANAEVYAIDAGLEADSEDIKVNIGEHVLRGLFSTWLAEFKRRNPSYDEDGTSHGRSPPTAAQKNTALRAADLPRYTPPDHIPVIVTEDHSPVPILRLPVGRFQGTEKASMPGWVVDLIRDGKGQTREVVKVSFTLEPAENSRLPELSTTSLNAPRVLRVRKVAVYIAKELKESRSNFDFDIESSHLEILCNGQALPGTMSLATVRQFKWRSPEDLHLQFRLKKGVVSPA